LNRIICSLHLIAILLVRCKLMYSTKDFNSPLALSNSLLLISMHFFASFFMFVEIKLFGDCIEWVVSIKQKRINDPFNILLATELTFVICAYKRCFETFITYFLFIAKLWQFLLLFELQSDTWLLPWLIIMIFDVIQ